MSDESIPEHIQHELLSMQDWLWRLDCIEKEFEGLLPDCNLYTAVSLKTSMISSGRELETFPYGAVSQASNVPCRIYVEPDRDALWFGLTVDPCAPLIVYWDTMGWSLQSKPPVAFWGDRIDDHTYMYSSGMLCSLYYFQASRATPQRTRSLSFISRFNDTQEAIAEACVRAPKSVYEALGADISEMARTSWPVTLLYFALKRVHPLIQAWGKAHWLDRGFPRRRNMDPDKASTFWDLNDALITLTPDVVTATKYAFDALRHIAKSTSSGDGNRMVQPPRRWTPPAGYIGAKTICGGHPYEKDGKSVPRTTLLKWVKRDKEKPSRDPASGECYYRECWVNKKFAKWHPHKRI